MENILNFFPLKVMSRKGRLTPLIFYFIHKRPIASTPIKCFLFADDANAFDKVKTIADCLLIQLSLNTISAWSLLWQLPLNFPKSIVLHLGRGNINFSCHINGIQLPIEDTVSDLGINISRDLTNHEHINKILFKFHKRFFIIKKSFNYKNPNINKLLFTTYMRPILNYGSLLWNPHSQHETDMIEHMQSHFLKYAITNLSVS